MSTPAEYYRSLPPVSRFYGVTCLLTTTAYYLQLYHPWHIALSYEDVIKRFQVWRLVTNFFFLGGFSFPFAAHLIMIANYGVSLERGPFDKRTADFVWMLIFGAFSLLVLAVVPLLWTPFMGHSLVYMILYVWGLEFPNAPIDIYGVSLKGIYLPWATLVLDLIFGLQIKPGILGIVAGHLYYFLTSSSSRRWKINLKDSSLGVCFYCFMYKNYFQMEGFLKCKPPEVIFMRDHLLSHVTISIQKLRPEVFS